MTRRTWSTTDSDVVTVADANDQIQAGIGEPLMCEGQVALRVDPRADGRPSCGCGAFRKEQSP